MVKLGLIMKYYIFMTGDANLNPHGWNQFVKATVVIAATCAHMGLSDNR